MIMLQGFGLSAATLRLRGRSRRIGLIGNSLPTSLPPSPPDVAAPVVASVAAPFFAASVTKLDH